MSTHILIKISIKTSHSSLTKAETIPRLYSNGSCTSYYVCTEPLAFTGSYYKGHIMLTSR